MPNALEKAFQEFMDEIPDKKLVGITPNTGLVYKNKNFRLDMQTMTTGTPQHNLQVQANRESPIAAVALLAKNTGADGTTVAHVNWDADAEDGEALRGALRAAYTPFVSSAHVAQHRNF